MSQDLVSATEEIWTSVGKATCNGDFSLEKVMAYIDTLPLDEQKPNALRLSVEYERMIENAEMLPPISEACHLYRALFYAHVSRTLDALRERAK